MTSETPDADRPCSGPVSPSGRTRCRAFIGSAMAAAAALALAGCGLAGTAASTATDAAAEAQQAKEARATEDRVKQQLDAAARAAARQQEDAEKAAQ